MEAELIIKLPDGSTQTLQLNQVALQTTYGLEQPMPIGSPASPVMTSRITLSGVVVSGGVVV